MASPLSRRAVVVVLVAVVASVLLAGTPARAAEKFASLVVDARSGKALAAVNADRTRYPASLTKIMTLYMVFDAIDRGRLRLGQRLTVSRRATAQPPSKLGLRPGATITVEDAILALVTKSANDVASVVAENLAPSESAFARKMTATAKAIGMTRTRFVNASGLPNPDQVTTARDMATLARAMLTRFPHHYHYFSTDRFYYGGTWHRNHNRLLGAYDGVDGIKTGYIRASGYNLVASAERKGRRIIGVVLGAPTTAERGRIMAGLLDKGFASRGGTVQTVGAVPPLPPVARPVAANDDEAVWGVQVGAFRYPRSARIEAEKARRAADRHFRGGGSIAVERSVKPGENTLYLSKIVGIDHHTATKACHLLKTKRMACMIVAAPTPATTVAARGDGNGFARPEPRPALPAAGRIGEIGETGESGESDAIGDADTEADIPYGVQIGAFPAYEQALQRAHEVKQTVPGILGQGNIAVVPTDGTGRRPLYRARIVGIDRELAQDACRALEIHAVSCMVLRL